MASICLGLNVLTLIPARISNYIHYKVWDEINYPFLSQRLRRRSLGLDM